MRLFRNLSRYKARKRLYGNDAALIPLLIGSEREVIVDSKFSLNDVGDEKMFPKQVQQVTDTGFVMTLDELATMNGITENTPIYISIEGYIYDVSVARDLYGPGGPYHRLVAIDGTKAYATGCLEESCIYITVKESPLTAQEQKEVTRWLDFYKNHDKYEYVGKVLDTSVVDTLVAQEVEALLHHNKDTGNQSENLEKDIISSEL